MLQIYNYFEQDPFDSDSELETASQKGKKSKKPHNSSSSAITKLSPALKNNSRVNVFINDQFAFSLTLAQVVDFKLKVGQVVTVKQLELLNSASEYGKLFSSTLEWVVLKPRSILETRTFLEKKLKNRQYYQDFIAKNADFSIKCGTDHGSDLGVENGKIAGITPYVDFSKHKVPGCRQYSPKKAGKVFPPEFIDQIVDELIKKKYLDDYKFARYYLETRKLKTGISQKKLKMELTRKGISTQTIEVLMDELRDDSTEIDKIIAKKAHKYTKEKLIQYLLRQGFDFELVRSKLGMD